VIVEPPVFEVDAVRDLLRGIDVSVEAPARPWHGDDVVGLLVWRAVTEQDMTRLPGLRGIVTGSIGFDHIDLEAARRRRIWLCNVPDYCVDEVADSTMALLLALLRGVVFLDRSVGDGRWDDHAAGPLKRISDIRLGIVGFGRIGRAVAKRSLALGMQTLATDPLVPAAALKAAGVKALGLDELLRTASAVTLHLPYTEESRHLIGRRELGLMPRGSYLVNTARGQLVDQEALLLALDEGRLAGAALDVLAIEPPGQQVALPRHPRLIVTPHAAWFSSTSEKEVVRRAVGSLRAILEGQQPEGVVVQGGAPAKLAID
jgi:D-3-phosphoglycerate dehydrogenase